MVVFVDLEDCNDAFSEKHYDQHASPFSLEKQPAHGTKLNSAGIIIRATTPSFSVSPRDNINGNVKPTAPGSYAFVTNQNRGAFSAALSCYPIVKAIARAIDLNTLHALSRTCRQFHVNLAQFRHQLIRETLRCENEFIETVADMLEAGANVPNSVKSVLRLLSQNSHEAGRISRGKVGKCARDMVDECRRCHKINCTIKPPSQSHIKGRIRRLCRYCCNAPLSMHLPNGSVLPEPRMTGEILNVAAELSRITGICNCRDAVWLCQQCGQTLRSDDTTYRRVWDWRTRYSTYLGGGLGTGIGEGSQGVKCGRGQACLAAKEIELEVDCEVDEGVSDGSSSSYSPPGHTSHHHHHHHHHHDQVLIESHDEEPGYFRQEIVGLGGLMKQKAKKRVLVGACVVEYEDERETGKYLEREELGTYRAWCNWCSRVIPARNEL
ncbi:hypothetical protein N7539_006310 [Penicillium diatomitis]|uniref:Uncharacterized protein n=1 Tax=Penicillium diatomitis TaxID=2819901 RepID=A0A9W9X2V8_9EURO|nr:uncharacterized protein N7539_006310 [Penicillium diatomitis]KAJ5482864.1 hypothetical protein N7539_006310 [Penicillium diatomitis]